MIVISDARPAPVVQDVEQAESVVCGVLTVDCAADTVLGFTVTPAVSVMPTPPAVAEIVLGSAMVELSVQVATPLPLAVCVKLTGDVVLPPVPEIAIVTLAFATALPRLSLAVTVMSVAVLAPVEQDVLQAVIVVGNAATVDCEAETVPAVMLNPELVSDASPVEFARKKYGPPTLSMLRLVNVATPPLAAFGFGVPDNVAPAGDGGTRISIPTEFVAFGTLLWN